ncbi:conserved exported hypothetical protein [Candidatus Sulfopaludibacter sp. SbA3]|nr:conserved exported hypothetical protein [Candidatus Sulfopaludibacter sp. SbA3]
MKWVLLAIAGLVVLVGLAALVGALLPLKHRATRKARYRASPEALYAVLAGPPDWRTGVKSFGVLPEKDGRKQWWEEDSHRQKITFELVEDVPARKLAVRIAGKKLPFGGTWTFDIAPTSGGGADLRITEEGEIYNVIFRFMARYFFGYTASIEGYLRDLATKFGDTAAIEA